MIIKGRYTQPSILTLTPYEIATDDATKVSRGAGSTNNVAHTLPPADGRPYLLFTSLSFYLSHLSSPSRKIFLLDRNMGECAGMLVYSSSNMNNFM